jgi:hypothetical protein
MAHSFFTKLWQRSRFTRANGSRLLRSPARFRPHVEGLEERWVLATVHWINPAGGFWADAASWSTGAVPGPDDDVVLDAPGDVTVNHSIGDDTVHSIAGNNALVLSGGSLSLDTTSAFDGPLDVVAGTVGVGFEARLTMNGPLLWTAGTIAGYGTVTANGGLDITGPDPKLLDGATLENSQRGTLSGSPLGLRDFGYFDNLPGATLTVEDSSIGAVDFNDFSGVTNQGEMQVFGRSGFGANSVSNTGTIRVHGGSFALNSYRGQASNSGTIELNGGDFSMSGDYAEDTGAVTGAGTVSVFGIEYARVGAPLMAAGNLNVSAAHASVGGLDGISVGGTVTVNALGISFGGNIHAGAVDLTGDDFSVYIGGTVSVDSEFRTSGMRFYFDNATIETATFTNGANSEFANSTLTADTVLNPGNLNFDDASAFTIRDITNTGQLSLAGSISGNLVNAGWLAIGGPLGIGQLTVGGDFTQTATGHVELDISRDGTQSNQLNVGGTAYLDGTLTVYAPSTLVEGASFQAITFAHAVGNFARYEMPNLDAGLFLDAVLGDDGLTLVVRRHD